MASEKEKTTKAQKEQSRSQKDKNEKRSENKSTSRSESKMEAGKSAKTTDHDTIRRWVEERGGKPATVRNTTGKNDPGLLRIDFPGRSSRGRDENTLEEISWDDFFEKFEEKKLAFLYQEKTKTGRESRFSKFVSREG